MIPNFLVSYLHLLDAGEERENSEGEKYEQPTPFLSSHSFSIMVMDGKETFEG
jgi:hypothetical protein